MQGTTATGSIEVPQVSTWTPPRWMNKMMILFLKTPGVQCWLGRTLALITFKGRKSGRLYTTPVTYVRSGDEVIFLSKRFRVWWRNLIDIPRVGLRLAGQNVRGRAEIVSNEDEALSIFVDFLEKRRQDARAYGLSFDQEGIVDLDRARMILPEIVVARVRLVDSVNGPGS